MQSQSIMNGNLGISRPTSEQVRDLHVYVIPPELWRQHLRSAANEVITDSISLGFLRIPPHIYLHEVRSEISSQLGDEYLPKDYAFLKSVGRCLTQVKNRQERELKVKHFLPPYAYAPELFILDAHAESMRDSPSTIFHHSLTATSLPKTGSKTSNTQHHNEDRSPHKYPSSQHGHMSPKLGGQPTYTVSRSNRQPAPGDNQYNSQVFDQHTMKSSYPSYSHPYSHDISALTNAHRNQVDTSQTFDHYPNNGGETYRKYNDDSSGYRSMPSPVKLAESPPRLHRGDNSGTRDHNPSPSSVHHNSYTGNDGEPNTSPRHPNSHSPRHPNSHSPHKGYANEIEPGVQRSQSRYQDSNRNRSRSPDSKHIRNPSDGNFSEPNRSYSEDRANDSSKRWADSVDAPENYEGGVQNGDREMMSATPNGPVTRQQVPDNNRRDPVQEKHSNESQHKREDYEGSSNDGAEERVSSRERDRNDSSEEKRELLKQLRLARDDRLASEKKREDLVKKARAMQAKTNNRRNQARERWKKKYYEAKKRTPGLESECQKIRAELDAIHKKYLHALEGSNANGKQKENYPLEAAKLQYDVDELQRKADGAKMKLTAEMKLRNQAETELRALRAELTQKKMNMNLSRAQKINSIGNSALSISSQ